MSDRRAYLANQAALGLLSPAEKIERDSLPLVVCGQNADGTDAPALIIPRIPGMSDTNTYQENCDAWLANGTGRTIEEVRAERLAAERVQQLSREQHQASMTTDQPAPVSDSPMPQAPTAQPATATPQAPKAETPKPEFRKPTATELKLFGTTYLPRREVRPL